MTIEWKEEFSVGVEKFDEHHRKLLSIINSLMDSANAGKGGDTSVVSILKELYEYSKYHFSEEEKELESRGYANLEKQKEEHARFGKQIHEYSSMFLADSEPKVSEVADFLSNWMLNHILEEDRRYMTVFK
ncbi:MAG: bacteriohemerythrin [Nitrospinota bacterium]|nr:bacteriohemerythrin [Nitrospinota bacterium]